MMQVLPPRLTVHLIPQVNAHLHALLPTLTVADWQLHAVGEWTVHDVVAHLLDTSVRRVSALRDGQPGPRPKERITGYDSLVAFINDMNHTWVEAMRRVSPKLLTTWLVQAQAESAAYLATLDPHAKAAWSVGWAGERESQNWFDIGRELTEVWHHQQQIRDAVGAPGLYQPDLYLPVLDVFFRGLPHAYRHVTAPEGTLVNVTVPEVPDASWYLSRTADDWQLVTSADATPAATISIAQDDAWRLLTKRWRDPVEAATKLHVTGDSALAQPLAHVTAVMA